MAGHRRARCDLGGRRAVARACVTRHSYRTGRHRAQPPRGAGPRSRAGLPGVRLVRAFGRSIRDIGPRRRLDRPPRGSGAAGARDVRAGGITQRWPAMPYDARELRCTGPQPDVRAAVCRVGPTGRDSRPLRQGGLCRRRRRRSAQCPRRSARTPGDPAHPLRPGALPDPCRHVPAGDLRARRRPLRLLPRSGRDHRPCDAPQPGWPPRLGQRGGRVRAVQPHQGRQDASRTRLAAARGAGRAEGHRVAGARHRTPDPRWADWLDIPLAAPPEPRPVRACARGPVTGAGYGWTSEANTTMLSA